MPVYASVLRALALTAMAVLFDAYAGSCGRVQYKENR